MLRIPLDIEYIKEHQKGLYIENTNLIEALEDYGLMEEDLVAEEFSMYYLAAIDHYVPYRIVNIIIEIIHQSRHDGLSEYAEIRACEDYVLKTEWFQDAEEWVQNRIREDFYNYFIDEISLAFHRRKQWKSKKQ
jgi:hypothetical protein